MKTSYNIRNFRAFDESGAEISFEPITILTGCNSSGKSSIVKSILLLKSFMEQIRNDFDNGIEINLSKYKLDFSKYPSNSLGRFDKVINHYSSSKKITFKYSVYSYMLSEDIDVQLTFASDENDLLNNGYLNCIKVINQDGNVIFSSEKGKERLYNLYVLKDRFFDFSLIEQMIHSFCGLHSAREGLGVKPISEEEYEKQKSLHISFLKGFENKRVSDILKFVRFSFFKKSVLEKSGTDMEVAEWSKGNGSIFNIPIMEVLKDAAKNEIESLMENYLPQKEDEFLTLSVKKIVQDFRKSDSETFWDFFIGMENRYLNCIDAYNTSGPRKLFHKVDMELPKTSDFDLRDVRDVYWNSKIIYSFGEERDIVKEHQDDVAAFETEPLTFILLYKTLMSLNSVYTQEQSIFYSIEEEFITGEVYAVHHMYTAFKWFIQELVLDALMPSWSENISYVSSARINAKRLYTLEANDDFTPLLKQYFEGRRLFFDTGAKHYIPYSFMNKWVQKYGIGQAVDIVMDDEGLGVKIYIVKGSEPEEKVLMADEGYGITQLFSILLQIEAAILSSRKEHNNSWWGLEELDGYDTQTFHYAQQTIAIEEPEIHLHPKYQSMLAEMFYEAYQRYNIHFIIETHSEYLVRKTQVIVAQMNLDDNSIKLNNPFRVYYIEKGKIPRDLVYQTSGRFLNEFGPGFFDVSKELVYKLF